MTASDATIACPTHVCLFDNFINNTDDSLEDYSREGLIEKYLNIIRVPRVDTMYYDQEFNVFSKALLYTFEGSEEEAEVKELLKQFVHRYYDELLYIFSTNTSDKFRWNDIHVECFGSSKQYYNVAKTYYGSGVKDSSSILHAKVTHMKRIIEACGYSEETIQNFSTKNPHNILSSVMISLLVENDVKGFDDSFPIEWVEAQYGVKLIDNHIHLHGALN